jgi:uncharacterized membrane protein YedE/YeeE
MQILMALLAGLVFGIGLIISGMSNPVKVLDFLDLGGAWDPSLALVMAGAIAVGLVAFRLARGRAASLLGESMKLPTATAIDRRLLLGALTFGAGWGLAGFCPGPALASLASGRWQVLLFVASMVGGMALFELLEQLKRMQRSGSR